MTAEWTGAEDAWRIVADRLAAADRENAELRGEVERLEHVAHFLRSSAEVDVRKRAAERDDLRAQLAAAERDRDEARSERDDAGLLWGRHYNDAMGALETQLAAAQAQLAEARAEVEQQGAWLETARKSNRRKAAKHDRLEFARRDAEARLEAVRALHRSDGGVEPSCWGCGRVWPCPTEAAMQRAALSAAPQPEPDLSERYFDTLLATTDDPAEKARIEEQRQKHRAQAEPPASDEPTGRSD